MTEKWDRSRCKDLVEMYPRSIQSCIFIGYMKVITLAHQMYIVNTINTNNISRLELEQAM